MAKTFDFLKKQIYKIIASVGPILSIMHELPVIIDMRVGQNFLQEDQLTQFLQHKTRTCLQQPEFTTPMKNHCISAAD